MTVEEKGWRRERMERRKNGVKNDWRGEKLERRKAGEEKE